MTTPYAGASLEEHLNRLKALLRVVDQALDHHDDEELTTGAAVCLSYAVDVVDKIQTGLSGHILGVNVKEG